MKTNPLECVFRSAALLLLAGYRKFLSPLKRPCCRFHPTCSVYAQQALRTHGFWRGSWLALRRVLRCHPYHHGPYHDPVPDSHPVPGPNLARRPHHEV